MYWQNVWFVFLRPECPQVRVLNAKGVHITGLSFIVKIYLAIKKNMYHKIGKF